MKRRTFACNWVLVMLGLCTRDDDNGDQPPDDGSDPDDGDDNDLECTSHEEVHNVELEPGESVNDTFSVEIGNCEEYYLKIKSSDDTETMKVNING